MISRLYKTPYPRILEKYKILNLIIQKLHKNLEPIVVQEYNNFFGFNDAKTT